MAGTVDKAAFDKVYDDVILGGTFVEFSEYYVHSRGRYWNAFQEFQNLGLPAGARVLDIGGGQFGVLLNRLLGMEAVAGDVVDDAREDLAAAGLDLVRVNLMNDDIFADQAAPFDCICMLEVIEHIPQPPYMVFNRLKQKMNPGGILFLTTPNGHRFRNLVYLALGREVLGYYRYPEGDEALGHQHEYTLSQMRWQASHAEMKVEFLKYYDVGWRGATLGARLARILTSPTAMIPHMKEGLIAAFRAG